jgi:hypothetical protein
MVKPRQGLETRMSFKGKTPRDPEKRLAGFDMISHSVAGDSGSSNPMRCTSNKFKHLKTPFESFPDAYSNPI